MRFERVAVIGFGRFGRLLADILSEDFEVLVYGRRPPPVPAHARYRAASLDDLKALQRAVFDIYVDPSLVSYAVDLATATREPAAHGLPDLAAYISFGASPRGPISLVQGARALALIRGREYALVEDLQALARDALRHRLVLSYQALAEDISPDAILEQVLATVPVPQLDLARASAA